MTTTNITLLISTINDGIFSTQHMTLPIAVQCTLTGDDNQRLIDTVQREVTAIMDERKAPSGDDAFSHSIHVYEGAIAITETEERPSHKRKYHDTSNAPVKKPMLTVETKMDELTADAGEQWPPATPKSPVFDISGYGDRPLWHAPRKIQRQETEVIPVEEEEEAEAEVPVEVSTPRIVERQETEVIPVEDDLQGCAPKVLEFKEEVEVDKDMAAEVTEEVKKDDAAEKKDVTEEETKISTCRGVVGRGARKGQPCQWRVVDTTFNLCKVHLNQRNHNYAKHQKNKSRDAFVVRIRDLIAKRSEFARKFPPLSLQRSTSSDVHC
jgi:hypothetical protein